MITTDMKTGRVTFFLTRERQLEMSASEYEHFESLIKNPPPRIEISFQSKPCKPWSPCIGEGCTHSSHAKERTPHAKQ